MFSVFVGAQSGTHCVSFDAGASTNVDHYYWVFDYHGDAYQNIDFSSIYPDARYCYAQAGLYNVRLVVSNASGTATATASKTIQVF
jgi:PKD repeat protein